MFLRRLRHSLRAGAPAITLAAAALLLAQAARAQELEPRAYSPSPTGTQFLVLGGLQSTGGVAIDPSLPLTNVQASVHGYSAAYGRTFGLGGRAASVALGLPYVDAHVTGDVGEVTRGAKRLGFGDMRLRLTYGLWNSPALSPQEFAGRQRGPALGAGLTIVAPTGEYLPDKLVNIGSNRWSFKPEIGLVWPAGKWDFEVTAGVWIFTKNDDFFGGNVREQSSLNSFQAHIAYSFMPRLWLAWSGTYYAGGRTTVNGLGKEDWQQNTRGGLTLAIPVTRRQSIKLNYSTGASTRVGADFDTFGLSWQAVWY